MGNRLCPSKSQAVTAFTPVSCAVDRVDMSVQTSFPPRGLFKDNPDYETTLQRFLADTESHLSGDATEVSVSAISRLHRKDLPLASQTTLPAPAIAPVLRSAPLRTDSCFSAPARLPWEPPLRDPTDLQQILRREIERMPASPFHFLRRPGCGRSRSLLAPLSAPDPGIGRQHRSLLSDDGRDRQSHASAAGTAATSPSVSSSMASSGSSVRPSHVDRLLEYRLKPLDLSLPRSVKAGMARLESEKEYSFGFVNRTSFPVRINVFAERNCGLPVENSEFVIMPCTSTTCRRVTICRVRGVRLMCLHVSQGWQRIVCQDFALFDVSAEGTSFSISIKAVRSETGTRLRLRAYLAHSNLKLLLTQKTSAVHNCSDYGIRNAISMQTARSL